MLRVGCSTWRGNGSVLRPSLARDKRRPDLQARGDLHHLAFTPRLNWHAAFRVDSHHAGAIEDVRRIVPGSRRAVVAGTGEVERGGNGGIRPVSLSLPALVSHVRDRRVEHV